MSIGHRKEIQTLTFRALADRPSYSPPTQHQIFFRYFPFNLFIIIYGWPDDFVELMLKMDICYARLLEIFLNAKMSAGNAWGQIYGDTDMDISPIDSSNKS